MIDFEKEITKYGQSLSERGKAKARTVFNELLAQGRTFEWLYYAIQHLNGRSLIDYPKLLFYKEFQKEVDEIMAEAHEKEQAKKEWQARICAGIEEQMKKFEEARENRIFVRKEKYFAMQRVFVYNITKIEYFLSGRDAAGG